MDNFEAEIAELQKRIEAKRNMLEQQGGIVEEKQLVREAMTELLASAQTQTVTPAPVPVSATVKPAAAGASYLDNLDNQTAETVNNLIQLLPTEGLAKAVAQAELAGPFVVDALHDALVDKLYDELKQRGLVK